MRYRLVFISGLGIGFLLGARAGRERYEQILKMARKAADSPAVQQAAGALQAQAASVAKTAKETLADRAGTARSKVGDALHDRVPGMHARDANGRSQAESGYVPAPGTAGDQPGE
jgi:hypothetical protein